jgi:hypothetical protein
MYILTFSSQALVLMNIKVHARHVDPGTESHCLLTGWLAG